MSEPIHVLQYRAKEYERRPIFGVIAILAIVFGACRVYALVDSELREASFAKAAGKSIFDVNSQYFFGMFYSLFEIGAALFLVSAGIAFFARWRRVVDLLSGYVGILICGRILELIAPFVRISGMPARPMQFGMLAVYSMASMSGVVFDVVILMLLRANPVRRLLVAAVGAKHVEA